LKTYNGLFWSGFLLSALSMSGAVIKLFFMGFLRWRFIVPTLLISMVLMAIGLFKELNTEEVK